MADQAMMYSSAMAIKFAKAARRVAESLILHGLDAGRALWG